MLVVEHARGRQRGRAHDAAALCLGGRFVHPELGEVFLEQWVDAIARLARNVALRREMGRAGRARVEAEYSLDRAVAAWASLLTV